MKVSAPVFDIASLARYILSPECRSIAFVTGAGISVASGIPDFRSPGGMYDTLKPDLLTCTAQERRWMEMDPTFVVTWDIFSRNAFPYLEVRRPFILGTQQQEWKATIAHRFLEILENKTDKLKRVYTQNIDGLDFQCSVPAHKIIPVHGSIAKARCEGCGAEMDFDTFCDSVRNNIKDIYNQDDQAPMESTPILCNSCHKPLVKPATVLFGRPLPRIFFDCAEHDLPTVDLLFIVGTSLIVSPAKSLVYRVPDTTKRVVVNLEPVGQDLGIDYSKSSCRDLFLQGTCDQIFLDLLCELEWIDELDSVMHMLPKSSIDLIRKKQNVST